MSIAKNWLIRTKSNHILGPVSKEKVIELYQNGSIKPDDEICSGNGFWFYLREQDLVSRYLMGDEVQTFNPISEAKDVLTATHTNQKEPTSDDITLIGSLNLTALKSAESAATDTKTSTATTQSSEASQAVSKKKTRAEVRLKNSTSTKVKKIPKKQNYLVYILMLGVVTFIFLIYFRKSLLPNFFKAIYKTPSIELLNSAIAQEDIPEKKKSSLAKK